MAKKITVRTVKAKPKVQMPSGDADAPAEEAKKPGLSMAKPSAAAPAAQGAVPDRLQNPFENSAQAQIAAKPENYTWQAILMLLATMMVLAIIGIQYFEWDLYTGGFTPVFMKTQPMMGGAPMLPPAAVDTSMDAPAADMVEDDMAEDDVLPE